MLHLISIIGNTNSCCIELYENQIFMLNINFYRQNILELKKAIYFIYILIYPIKSSFLK